MTSDESRPRLDPDEVDLLARIAVRHGLAEHRRALVLDGLPDGVRGSLPSHGIPLDQARSDLTVLVHAVGREDPLRVWLSNAERLVAADLSANVVLRLAARASLQPRSLTPHPTVTSSGPTWLAQLLAMLPVGMLGLSMGFLTGASTATGISMILLIGLLGLAGLLIHRSSGLLTPWRAAGVVAFLGCLSLGLLTGARVRGDEGPVTSGGVSPTAFGAKLGDSGGIVEPLHRQREVPIVFRGDEADSLIEAVASATGRLERGGRFHRYKDVEELCAPLPAYLERFARHCALATLDLLADEQATPSHAELWINATVAFAQGRDDNALRIRLEEVLAPKRDASP